MSRLRHQSRCVPSPQTHRARVKMNRRSRTPRGRVRVAAANQGQSPPRDRVPRLMHAAAPRRRVEMCPATPSLPAGPRRRSCRATAWRPHPCTTQRRLHAASGPAMPRAQPQSFTMTNGAWQVRLMGFIVTCGPEDLSGRTACQRGGRCRAACRRQGLSRRCGAGSRVAGHWTDPHLRAQPARCTFRPSAHAAVRTRASAAATTRRRCKMKCPAASDDRSKPPQDHEPAIPHQEGRPTEFKRKLRVL